jgi:hypothetical protein
MSTMNGYRPCLNELAADMPKKKTAPIRSLLPSIEKALSSGQTLKDFKTTLLGALKQQPLARKGLIKAFDKSAPRIVGVPRLDMHSTYGKQTGRKLSDYILTNRLTKLFATGSFLRRQMVIGLLRAESASGQKSETITLALDVRALSAEQGDTMLPIRSAVVKQIAALGGVDRTHLVHSCLIPC